MVVFSFAGFFLFLFWRQSFTDPNPPATYNPLAPLFPPLGLGLCIVLCNLLSEICFIVQRFIVERLISERFTVERFISKRFIVQRFATFYFETFYCGTFYFRTFIVQRFIFFCNVLL